MKTRSTAAKTAWMRPLIRRISPGRADRAGSGSSASAAGTAVMAEQRDAGDAQHREGAELEDRGHVGHEQGSEADHGREAGDQHGGRDVLEAAQRGRRANPPSEPASSS